MFLSLRYTDDNGQVVIVQLDPSKDKSEITYYPVGAKGETTYKSLQVFDGENNHRYVLNMFDNDLVEWDKTLLNPPIFTWDPAAQPTADLLILNLDKEPGKDGIYAARLLHQKKKSRKTPSPK